MYDQYQDEDLKPVVSDENVPLDEERFEPIQKAFYLKINLPVAIVVIVFCIAIAVLCFIKYHHTDLGPFLIYGIVMCLAVITGAISLLFAKGARTSILNGYLPDAKSLKLGEITFLIGMVTALAWGVILPVSFLWSFESKFLGNNWEDSKDYLWVYITVGSVALLTFTYLIFVSWTVAVRKVNLRVLGSICLVGVGVFALLTIWFSDNAVEYENQRVVAKVGLGPLKSAYFFSVVILILVLAAFVAFILRLRIFFLIVGGVFLFFAAFFVIHSGMVFRKAQEIKAGYGNNCHKIVSWTNMEEAKHQGCNKYLEGTCEANRQALKWEQDLNVENSKKKNDLACLNLDCCKKLTGNACKNVFRAGASVWGMAVFCFALSATCLFLTQKEIRDKNKKKKPIYFVITGIILIALCVVAIIVIETTRHKPKSEQPLVAAKVTSILPFKQSKIQKDYVPGINGCKGIYEHMTSSQKSNLNCNSCKGVRISLKVHNGAKIVLDKSYNSNDIYIFSEKHSNEIYPSSKTFSRRTFLMVEGTTEKLKEYLTKYALLCPGKDNSYDYSFNYYHMPTARTLQAVPNCNITHGKPDQACPNIKKESLEVEETTLKLLSMPTEDNQKALTNKYKWKNISVRIYNAKTAKPEPNVEVYIIPGVSACNEDSTRSFDVIKDNTDKEGLAHLFNVIVKPHTLIVKKRGYKANCRKLTITESGDHLFSLPIVEEQYIGKIGVLIETSRQANIQLAATFVYNDRTICNSAFFQRDCGHMHYHEKQVHKERFYQISNIDQLGEYFYLFYWSVIDGKEKALEKLKAVDYYRYTVYLKQSEYPIDIDETKPTVVTGMEKDDYPTYLAFCLNGKVGTASYSKIDKYWIRDATSPSIYEKSINDERELPTADICEKHYKAQSSS